MSNIEIYYVLTNFGGIVLGQDSGFYFSNEQQIDI